MSKARTLANLISDNAELADGQISVAEVVGAAPLANPTFTGTATGTFSGPLTGNVTGNLTGNVTGDITGGLDLSAISATINDTAVDVFVYDTSKDSDGGAWRHRTQHTSWYNETLSTSTRGSRKEFPAVAVIVAEADTVTIYDGDDPSMPMWMVFNSGTTWTQYTGGFAVEMLNGIMFIGRTTSNGRGLHIGFVNDFAFDVATTSTGAKRVPILNGVVNRNAGNAYDGGTTDSTFGIVDRTINDVAMTVLPNAPIDAATGLPVPTIAVATDGGVSVIKDDGTVVDITHTASVYKGAEKIELIGNQIVYASQQSGSSTNRWRMKFIDIPSSDVSGAYLTNVAGFQLDARGTTGYYPALNTDSDLAASTNDIKDFAYNKAVGFSDKLTQILGADTTSGISVSSGYPDIAVAYISSDYNTGYQVGDIKLATLSDTDDTNVTGTSLAANGTFSSDTSWTKGEQWTISGGSASITDSPNRTSDSYLEQNISGLVAGKQYVIRITYSGSIGDIDAYLGGNRVFSIRSTYGNSADLYLNLTAGPSDTKFAVVANQHFVGSVDNFELYEAAQDRSVNGNGLQVLGTVTKSAVATGADLVAYRANDTSSGLVQPHNTDFEFGTGDFSFMFWGRQDASASLNGKFLSLGDTNSAGTAWTGPNINIDVNNAGLVKAYITDDAYVTNDQIELNADGEDGNWYCYALVRRGNSFYGYKNGELNESVAVSNAAASLTNDDNKLCVLIDPRRVAGNTGYGSSTEVDIALLRVSATAPSPEHIKKIYEDEKVLFQEGAQATLYGSSDAVTALAYDDSTELLHVGTSAGRSVFQGLRRVDNTTDAVGAAISASNGLVAED